MCYINDSITSITTKWLSQLQKVEAKNSEVGLKMKNRENSKFSKKVKLWSKFTTRTCVPCVRLRALLVTTMRFIRTTWRCNAITVETMTSPHSIYNLATVFMSRNMTTTSSCGFMCNKIK